jgi:hypothetical protein
MNYLGLEGKLTDGGSQLSPGKINKNHQQFDAHFHRQLVKKEFIDENSQSISKENLKEFYSNFRPIFC